MPKTWRILAVAYRMPPLLSPRAIQVHRLLNHWSRHGHEVHVVCATEDTAPWPEHDEDWTRADPALYRTHPVPSPEAGHVAAFRRRFPQRDWRQRTALQIWGRLLSIPDPQRYWVCHAARKALDLCRRLPFDVLITFGNPMSDHLVGPIVKDRTGIRWLAHFSDPWVDNPYKRWTPFVRHVNRWQERRVAARADHTIFVTDETRDLEMRKYSAHLAGRARTIPHYFDSPPKAEPPADRMVFRHVGTFYGHRTPEPLFAALASLHRRRPDLLAGVAFDLIGPVYPPGLMDRWRRGFNLPETVTHRPSVPHLESLGLMAASHVLISFDADVAGGNVFLPSKLIDYLGANRPLLGVTPLRGPSADLIRRAGGLVAAPADTEGIARAITQLIEAHRAGSLFRERTPPPAVRAEYRVDAVAPRFETLFAPASGEAAA